MKQKINYWKAWWANADPIRRKGVAGVVIAFIIMLIIIIFKKVSYVREAHARQREIQAGPLVQTAIVQLSAPERSLVLLGEARPFESVTLYAKVSGFLHDVHVDKGDPVEKGDLLAVVESPETNQDYDAAVADAHNKQAIAERIRPLLEQKLVSQQEADQAFADADIASARLHGLEATKGYQEIRAPFSGMVTARFVDPGALIQNAQNAQTGAQALFTVSQIDRLRVYVYIDQKDAGFIRRGLPVVVSLQERPEVNVQATLTRFSGELDERTRTLLAEVDLDNRKGLFVAGSFVQVALKVPAQRYLQMPVEALVVRQAKSYASIVTASNTLTYREVAIADNDGQQVKILTGLQAGDTVALNVGASLEEGSLIRPVTLPNAPPPVAAANSSPGNAPAGLHP
jgi:RND family efflux transporter MFP subunit